MILAVDGVCQTIRESEALNCLMLNIANWKGDTLGFKASDYARVVTERLGKKLDYLIYPQNQDTVLDSEVVAGYKEEGQEIVELDDEVFRYVDQVRCFDLVAVITEKTAGMEKKVFRHSPKKTADALMEIWKERVSGVRGIQLANSYL